jgi:2-amino-4-hydroxy-6-hydroxymethyldihydropteridine diphosphokinase
MGKAVVALGSNIPPRRKYLKNALRELTGLSPDKTLICSKLYETEPVGGPRQGWFLNLAAAFETALGPLDLMEALLAIEKKEGRIREIRNGPRVIDLDLIFYDDLILDETLCRLPHPRFAERGFVLLPLFDIIPGFVDPETGQTVEDLLKAWRLSNPEICRPVDPL